MSTATTSKERPIMFYGPMVRAILAGTKTQTRRVIKPRGGRRGLNVAWHIGELDGAPWPFFDDDVYTEPDPVRVECPYGQPGDRLWARETWAPHDAQAKRDRDRSRVYYRADDARVHESDGRWNPSLYMPRWASRITLEITGVRVERLQDISEDDALAEGLVDMSLGKGGDIWTASTLWPSAPADHEIMQWPDTRDPRVAFRWLWSEINGAESWPEHQWVWVLEVKRLP